jgi:fumarate reductase flavoprotein subunit
MKVNSGMTADLPTQWGRETDVAVIGGGAGLAAALEATNCGAKVTLLEKCARLGGTTGIAVGSFTAAGTSLQRAAQIQDDSDSHSEDMGKFAGHRDASNNHALRSLLARNAADTLEWLIGLGVSFHGPYPEPPNRQPRRHNVVPNGKACIAVLQNKILRLGCEVLVKHRAERLFREPGGAVIGLEAIHGGVSLRVRSRNGVVLAAGDYSSGDDIRSRFLPPDIAAVEGVNPNSTGDGHRLAESVGAGLVNMQLVYGPEIRFVPPPRPPFVQLLPGNPRLAKILGRAIDLLPKAVLHRVIRSLLVTWQHPETSLFAKGAVLINRDGQRFTDECAEPELAVWRQPGKLAYCVLDAKLMESFSRWPNPISTAPGIAYAYIQDYKRLRPDIYTEAPTLSELARQIDVSPAALETSIGDYNRAAQGDVADVCGRRCFGPPLTTAPFCALGPAKSWLVTTEGGVRINQNMQALDAEDRVIPGLYAAGSNGMGGIVAWGHGLHLAWAFTSGRIAATAHGAAAVN